MAKATGWDPVLIVSQVSNMRDTLADDSRCAQIIAMQTLHYVTLSLLIPPLLVMFAEPGSLEYEGGAANVGMRRDVPLGGMSSLFFSRHDHGLAGDGWKTDHSRAARRRSVEVVQRGLERREAGWAGARSAERLQECGPCAVLDHRRVLDGGLGGRVRAIAVIVRPLRSHACRSVYYLYGLVRRPRLILDFSLTLLFNHLVLTTYYSAAIPTSLFFYLVMCLSTAGTVIFAEQLCVKREMNEGLVVASAQDGEDNMEMGSLLRED